MVLFHQKNAVLYCTLYIVIRTNIIIHIDIYIYDTTVYIVLNIIYTHVYMYTVKYIVSC